MRTIAVEDIDPSPAPLHPTRMRFAYHRSLGSMVGVLLGLGVVEAIVVHIAATAYWGWKVAIGLGAIDLAAIAYLVGLLRSFRRRPIVLEDGMLTLRTGHRLAVSVPLTDIAGLRDQWTRDDIKAPQLLNMALIAWPNIVIDLARPIARRRRSITAIAHCLDDPVAFRRAIADAAKER